MGPIVEQQIERLNPILDRRLNTADDMFFPSPKGEGGVGYVAGPTPWHILPRGLRKIGACGDDVFVEFGCGKGRIVHQAAKRPLKRVIGVEILPEVASFAQSLVASNRHKYRCGSVEIVTCDAERFRVPDDLTIAYHAYGLGAKMVDAVLRNIIESIDEHPRRVSLIYYKPSGGGAQVLATGRFRLVDDISFGSALIFESCGS